MKKIILALAAFVLFMANASAAPVIEKPWEHGKLQVSANHRYLQHADGTPFFWLGETAWLKP